MIRHDDLITQIGELRLNQLQNIGRFNLLQRPGEMVVFLQFPQRGDGYRQGRNLFGFTGDELLAFFGKFRRLNGLIDADGLIETQKAFFRQPHGPPAITVLFGFGRNNVCRLKQDTLECMMVARGQTLREPFEQGPAPGIG